MKRNLVQLTFWLLVINFALIVSQLTLPLVREALAGSNLFLLPSFTFCLFGVVLLIVTLKERIEGLLKTFLLLTGASATGFFVFILLHNLFYGLSTLTTGVSGLNYLMAGLEGAFFIIALFICPLGFLIGLVGSIILLVKKKNKL